MANQVLKSINEGKRVGQKRENLTLGYNNITKVNDDIDTATSRTLSFYIIIGGNDMERTYTSFYY